MRWRGPWAFLAVGVLTAANVRAGTPMDAPLPEAKITEIECEYALTEPDMVREFGLAGTKGTYHYKVYVPADYTQDAKRRYPCLFIASPGGNAAMGNVGDRMQRDNWIAIMLVESKNGPFGPILGNFLAAHDDAVRRLRIQEGMKYATGFSGGARAASVFVGLRPGFAGAVLQGAGFGGTYQSVRKYKTLSIYAIFGENDPNRDEIQELTNNLGAARFKYEVFPGGHAWAPPACMDRAFDWLQEQFLFNSGPIPPEIAARFFRARFAELDKAASPLDRYGTLLWLTNLALRQRLQGQADLKGPLAAVAADLKKVKQDPALKQEIPALEAFEKAKEKEAAARAAAGRQKGRGDALKRALAVAAEGYKNVASRYPDTEYGKKGAEAAEQLKAGQEPSK